MNESPVLNFNGRSGPAIAAGCGRQALLNREGAWWQSRSTIAGSPAPPMPMLDIRALARQIRRTWPG